MVKQNSAPNPCGLCSNIIDDETEDSIECDKCASWIHFECDGIIPKNGKQVRVPKKYICSACLGKTRLGLTDGKACFEVKSYIRTLFSEFNGTANEEIRALQSE